MADIIEDQQVIAPDAKTELANAMALALGGRMPEAALPGDVVTDTVVEIPFSFDTLKEKFGYQTPADVEKEIAELRQLKANPPLAPVIEFENEYSKQLLQALSAGKTKEVYQMLEKQARIDELTATDVTETNAADIVKYGMSLKYQNLTPAEVDYKFKKQFGVPKKPEKSADEDDTEYDQRLSIWQEQAEDRKMELMIEAKTARPEIEAARSKLVLPEIESQDKDYISYKQAIEAEKKLATDTATAYKAFTPTSIETKLNFNDEANGIAFDFQYVPDATSFTKAIEMTTDIDKFYDNFKNQDGTPDRAKFLRTIYNAMNLDSILTEAMKQAKNATIKSMLPDNSGGGMVRHIAQPQTEPTDMEKYMRAAGIIK